MSFARVIGVASFTAAAALLGCSSNAETTKDEIGSFDNELKLATPKYLGTINKNQTKTSSYSDPPRYRAYGFIGTAGDEVTADITSVDGDAMGWITDTQYNVLASNDDASSSTLNSKVKFTVPETVGSRSYRIVFRDYEMASATFKVKLSIKSAPTTCSYDGETYEIGDTFPSTDGCNTCSCGTGGVGCTKKACLSCNPSNEPRRNYLGTPSQCMTMRYTCPFGWRSFQNACGCGCEH